MYLRLNLLRWPDYLRETLSQDGWVISASERNDALDASHREVISERIARLRLQSLGLLTSSALRIEFCPWRQKSVPPPS